MAFLLFAGTAAAAALVHVRRREDELLQAKRQLDAEFRATFREASEAARAGSRLCAVLALVDLCERLAAALTAAGAPTGARHAVTAAARLRRLKWSLDRDRPLQPKDISWLPASRSLRPRGHPSTSTLDALLVDYEAAVKTLSAFVERR